MNQTVKRIVDILFQDTVENEETRTLHEELMNNCQEHYDDLIARGLSEDEAVGEVVESLKGMKDVIAQYPRKSGAGPEIREGSEGQEWHFTGIKQVKAETMDQDLYVTSSGDGAVHVYCDDPQGLTAESQDGILSIRGEAKLKKAASAFEMEEGEEITLNGLLNMVGRAIRSVTDSFRGGAPIRIEIPDGAVSGIELNSRSGDIQCSCAMARQMTVRSTSGDVNLEPAVEKTAEVLLVSTVSGEADVHGSSMDAEISSMSGDVTADGVFGDLRLKSTSGDIGFSGSVGDLTAQTVSGDVDVTVENNTVRHIEAKSTSGDVEIELPSGLPGVHAECSTLSGQCLSRVSDAGAGAPVQIRAKSTSGDVTVQ